MSKIKECANDTIRTIRTGTWIAESISPAMQRGRTDLQDCITYPTKTAARSERYDASIHVPGTLVYLLDPGSVGQDVDAPRSVIAWAYVVLP